MRRKIVRHHVNLAYFGRLRRQREELDERRADVTRDGLTTATRDRSHSAAWFAAFSSTANTAEWLGGFKFQQKPRLALVFNLVSGRTAWGVSPQSYPLPGFVVSAQAASRADRITPSSSMKRPGFIGGRLMPAVGTRRSSTISPLLHRTQICDSLPPKSIARCSTAGLLRLCLEHVHASDCNQSARRDGGQPLHLICFGCPPRE